MLDVLFSGGGSGTARLVTPFPGPPVVYRRTLSPVPKTPLRLPVRLVSLTGVGSLLAPGSRVPPRPSRAPDTVLRPRPTPRPTTHRERPRWEDQVPSLRVWDSEAVWVRGRGGGCQSSRRNRTSSPPSSRRDRKVPCLTLLRLRFVGRSRCLGWCLGSSVTDRGKVGVWVYRPRKVPVRGRVHGVGRRPGGREDGPIPRVPDTRGLDEELIKRGGEGLPRHGCRVL